jgi:serine/threonine-protein kinase
MNELSAEDWTELADLFDELTELPPSQRQARLDGLRQDRPDFAERLASMLSADSSAEGMLERSLDELAPDLHATLRSASWETRPGESIGRYRLIEPIGSGGMGEVWLAERIDGDYGMVALKFLKRGMDTQAILRRFLQERSILARLSHPNIVRLLDGGMSEDGRPYYVMERVAGLPLTTFAAANGLGVRERVALVAAIADAVGYAHAQLVVHRDLKPSNVIVDQRGVPHLLDFGIAKLLEDTGEQTMTGTGVRALSPAYAAPEQILGDTVGTPADIYALGVLLYELLTGGLPHKRNSRDPALLASGLSLETTEKASHSLARNGTNPASKVYGADMDVRRLSREIAGDLDIIVAKALNAEPSRRYATSAAFADDLRRWLDGRPIMARPDSARYRFGKFVRRHTLGVIAAGLVLLALVGGLSLALWQAGVARQQALRAQNAEADAQRQAEIATAVSDFLMRDVIQAANPYGGTLDISLTDALVRAGDRIDERFAGNPRMAGVVHRELAGSLRLAGEEKAALANARKAYDGLRASLAPDDPELQQARLMLARILHSDHDYEGARAICEEGVNSLGPDAAPQALLPFRVALAGIKIEDRQENEALAELDVLEPAVRRHFGELSELHIDVLDHQMRAYTQIDRYEEAHDVAHALRLGVEQRFGAGHPLTLRWLMREAVTLTSLERYDEALPLAKVACDASEKALGAEHEATQQCRIREGVILFELKRFDEAAPLFQTASDFRERLYGPESPNTWLGWVWLARAKQRLGMLDEAQALLERADATATRTLGADDPDAMPYRQTLGMFLEQTGRHDEAYALRMALLKRSQQTMQDHVITVKFAWDMAETLASMRRDAELIVFCAEWLPKWQRDFPANDSRLIDVRAWLDAARKRQNAGG